MRRCHADNLCCPALPLVLLPMARMHGSPKARRVPQGAPYVRLGRCGLNVALRRKANLQVFVGKWPNVATELIARQLLS